MLGRAVSSRVGVGLVAVVTLATPGCTEVEPGDGVHSGSHKLFAPTNVALNENVARSAHIDAIRPGGSSGYDLTGAGVLVAEWDEGGARETHRDLAGRVALSDGAGLSDHATHVAATIAGSGRGDPSALGM